MSALELDPDRVARAATALRNGRVPAEGRPPGTYTVPSFTSEASYTVDLRDRTCTCPDHQFRGEPCKHVYAVALTRGLT